MKNFIIILFINYFFLSINEAFSQILLENIPSKKTSSKPIATGASVHGVFEGRCPCQELAKELKIIKSPECFKTKWGLTLWQNPDNQAPSTYKIESSFYRKTPREGTWSIIKGTKTNPDAIVYQLVSEGLEPIFLMKGDENVLFFLDKNKNFLAGNILFSYTLNRVTQ